MSKGYAHSQADIVTEHCVNSIRYIGPVFLSRPMCECVTYSEKEMRHHLVLNFHFIFFSSTDLYSRFVVCMDVMLTHLA